MRSISVVSRNVSDGNPKMAGQLETMAMRLKIAAGVIKVVATAFKVVARTIRSEEGDMMALATAFLFLAGIIETVAGAINPLAKTIKAEAIPIRVLADAFQVEAIKTLSVRFRVIAFFRFPLSLHSMMASATGMKKHRIYWMGLFLLLLAGITATGALLGGLLFILGNPLFDYNLPIPTALMNGMKDGGFFAFIWAPALSFIRCVVLWRKSRNL